MAEPKHVDTVRQCLADGVLRSARDLGLALELDRSAVYSALNWLQASGEAAPQGGWPRRWGTTTTSLAEQISDSRERCDVAAAWLASAMDRPSWVLVPPDIQTLLQRAYVELTERP
jgi:hypothetical protein